MAETLDIVGKLCLKTGRASVECHRCRNIPDDDDLTLTCARKVAVKPAKSTAVHNPKTKISMKIKKKIIKKC